MIEINLLPKEYQKRKFRLALEKNTLYVIGGGVIILALLAAYTVFFQVLPGNSLNKKIEIAQADSAALSSEILMVNELTEKKNRLLARMSTIELLDRNRETWINVTSDLGARIPDYLWLTELTQAPQTSEEGEVNIKAFIQGRSFSLNSLATFIVRLKKSHYFKNIEISKIQLIEEKGAEVYSFTINCDLYLNRTSEALAQNKTVTGKLVAGSEF
jgi:Tfp pilus assembly protein PilN